MMTFKLFLWRYLAESNCSTRFCRPLPNRSAKVPFLFCGAKIRLFFDCSKLLSLFMLKNLLLTFVCRSSLIKYMFDIKEYNKNKTLFPYIPKTIRE